MNPSTYTVQTASNTSGYGNIWINPNQSANLWPQSQQVYTTPGTATALQPLPVPQPIWAEPELDEPDPAEVEATIESLLEMRRKFAA